jgi:hypothetical protein
MTEEVGLEIKVCILELHGSNLAWSTGILTEDFRFFFPILPDRRDKA